MALKMIDLPTKQQMVGNIIYTWLTANAEDMEEGVNWYHNAYMECFRIAKQENLSILTVAALVSVISPSIMWGGNITAPEKIIDLYKRGIPAVEWQGFNIYPANLLKAEAILNGDLSVVRGMKVNAFMQNILGEKNPVTIDRWAIRVAMGDPTVGKDKITPSGKKVYAALADAYREAAELMGTDNPTIQAVTWTAMRNKYNGRVRKQKEREQAIAA